MRLRNVTLNLDKVPGKLDITINGNEVRYIVAKCAIDTSIIYRIENTIKDKYGYTFESMNNSIRSPFLLAIKQLAMFLLHVDAGLKAREVAKIFNCTTRAVAHNKASVYSQIEKDVVFKDLIKELRNKFA